jgi:AcrR family transcriptional regulator
MDGNSSPSRSLGRFRALKSGTRERILDAAYDLFSQYGVRAVGIDAVTAHSGVARMTLYRHFGSKDELVLEFLRQRERKWTIEWLRGEVERSAEQPAARLLAVFELFDQWFQSDRFEGCSFINVLLESPSRETRVRNASRKCLENIRLFLRELAEQAGIDDPDGFASKWHLLMNGAIVAAQEGDRSAARRAREMAAAVLDQALSA